MSSVAISPTAQAQSDNPPAELSLQAAAGDLIPDQYIVVLRDQVTPAGTDHARAATAAERQAAAERTRTLLAQLDGAILHTYTHALHGFAVRIPASRIDKVAAAPDVAYVEPDRIVRAAGVQTPAGWGLDRIDQHNSGLNNAYTYAATGVGVHAYILDSGIRATHREFTGRIGNGFDALQDGNGTNDCYGHGTHVAGTLGGTTYGVAKAVTLHPVRVLNCSGSGYISQVVAGIDWVTANQQSPAVANLSLETGFVNAVLDQALQTSIAAGVTYVAAGGNTNQDACGNSPGRVAEALTVGALTQTDQRAAGTNYGPCLDLFAPGYQILSAWHTGNSATQLSNGTSMAAPHVAGAVALFLEQQPDATPATVSAALVENAAGGKLREIGVGSPNLLLHTGFLMVTPGDGNVDGAVNAGDLTACVQEIFDGDGNLPQETTGGTFPGTRGCDANTDVIIDAADISCIVLLIFRDVLSPLKQGSFRQNAFPNGIR